MKIIIPWPAIKTVIIYAMNSNLSVKKRTLASHPIPITIVSDIDDFNQYLTNNNINLEIEVVLSINYYIT